MTVHMGFLGGATLNGTFVYLTGASLNPVQNIEAPELISGTLLKNAWNFGKIEIGGNITGPFSELTGSLMGLAVNRQAAPNQDQMATTFPVEIWYYNGGGMKFDSCCVNTFEISVTAGEVANFTMDLMGAAETPGDIGLEDPGTFNLSPTCAKLITWDRCRLGGASHAFDAQSYSITFNNNLKRVYRIQPGTGTEDDLTPFALVAGQRDVTGTMTVYADNGSPLVQFAPNDGGGDYGADNYDAYSVSTASSVNSLTFQIGAVLGPVTFPAVFRRSEASAKPDLALYTLNFQVLCNSGVLASPAPF